MSIIILRLSLSLLVLVLFVNPIVVSSSSSGVQHSTNDLHWEEEIPPQIVEKEPDDEAPSSKRPLFWRPQQLQVRRPQRKQPKPHPMRTNLWKLKFTSRNRDYFQNETMIFEFDELGFCKNDKAQVGKWNMVPAGVLWKLPSGLQFYAEIHLQPFGDHPRMLRGVVVRDRTAKSNLPKNWLRPVVGTFEAVGIGEDLTDLTYADRGFALESTHTFLK